MLLIKRSSHMHIPLPSSPEGILPSLSLSLYESLTLLFSFLADLIFKRVFECLPRRATDQTRYVVRTTDRLCPSSQYRQSHTPLHQPRQAAFTYFRPGDKPIETNGLNNHNRPILGRSPVGAAGAHSRPFPSFSLRPPSCAIPPPSSLSCRARPKYQHHTKHGTTPLVEASHERRPSSQAGVPGARGAVVAHGCSMLLCFRFLSPRDGRRPCPSRLSPLALDGTHPRASGSSRAPPRVRSYSLLQLTWPWRSTRALWLAREQGPKKDDVVSRSAARIVHEPNGRVLCSCAHVYACLVLEGRVPRAASDEP